MWTVNQEKDLYIPYNVKTGGIGYCLDITKKGAREKLCELMGDDTWKNLAKRGWIIIRCEIASYDSEHPDCNKETGFYL